MIEVFTDGSFNSRAINNDDMCICGGVGIVIRLFSNSDILEVEKEEYLAKRYTISELKKIVNELNIDESNITSTLIECIAFKDGLYKTLEYFNSNDIIKCYVDDSATMKIVNTYINIKLNDGDITKSRRYGVYMRFLEKFLPTDLSILKRIKIKHVVAHRTNKYNNMADKLASYKASPSDRVISCLAHNSQIDNEIERKNYFLMINSIKKSQ